MLRARESVITNPRRRFVGWGAAGKDEHLSPSAPAHAAYITDHYTCLNHLSKGIHLVYSKWGPIASFSKMLIYEILAPKAQTGPTTGT